MRCVIPTCDLNSGCAIKAIKFISMPTNPPLLAEWLKVLKMKPSELSEDSAVCSKHFLKRDLYVNRQGKCIMRTGALPIVYDQLCRICFATDCKLYNMEDYNKLEQAYNVLTGLSVDNEEHLPPYLCFECAQRLLNCVQFRSRSLQAHLLLLEVVKKRENITLQSIKSVVGNEGLTGSQLKTTRTYHYDLNMNNVKEERKETEDPVDLTVNNVDVKIEKDDAVDKNIGAEDTANEHEGHFTDLHEYYDIKMDIDVDIDDNQLPSFGQENVEENVVKGEADVTIVYDNIDANTAVKKVPGIVEKEELLLMVKKKNKDIKRNKNNNKVELKRTKNNVKDMIKINKTTAQGPSQGTPTPNPTSDNLNFIPKKLIVTPGTIQVKPIPERLCPTNIIKLRKRVPGETSTAKNKVYDKFPYQTISDVPVWGRLKTNTAIKPFSCGICDFETGYKKEFLMHEKTHGIDRSESSAVKTNIKPFSCSMCHYKTLFKKEFSIHEKIHEENPEASDLFAEMGSQWGSSGSTDPVSCDVCEQMFDNTTLLHRHMELTSDGKPYSCDFCKKKFKFNCLLHKHLRKHTGEKPYSCQLCKREFHFEASLYSHNKRHHPGENLKKPHSRVIVNRMIADFIIKRKDLDSKNIKKEPK